MQLFHKHGNLGIELCPKCFENLKGLIEDINEIKEMPIECFPRKIEKR